jgi:VWFA-related protein
MPLLVAATALPWALAQSPTPPAQSGVTLRTTTTLLQLSVAAHDSKGRAVTDLKKEDFEVFDNGKPQDIAVFTADTAAPAPRSAPLNAFPEDVVEPAGRPGGNAVILLDYLNSGQIPAMRARVEIVRFLDNFDPTGKVALYVLDDSGTRLIGDFGSDRDALLKKIATVIGRPSRCNDNPIGNEACEREEKEFFWFQREFRTLGAFDSFADRLSFAAGRKALIWVSTASDVKDELAQAGMARTTPFLDAEKERVMQKLNNADVALYPIDSCGLSFDCKSHPSAMDDYASQTGGVAVHGLNGLDVSIRDAVEDVGFTYSLAFYPPQDGARTDFHRLKVQVRRPGIALKYKQGYSLEAPATVTAASLSGPIPGAEARALAAQMAIRAAGAPIASPSSASVAASMLLPYFYTAPNVALVNLAMEIGTADLKFRTVDGKQHAELRLDAVASRPDGGVAGRFSDTVKLDFAAEAEVEAFRKRPYNYEHQFRLASGQYDVRVAFGFGEEGSGKVEIPLVIDGWDGQRLALSGVALAKESRKVAADFTSGLDLASVQGRKPLIARSVEIIPAGSNRFQRAEPCLAFLEIYEPLLSGPHPPKISLQIRVLDRQTGEQKVDSGIFGVDNLIRAGDQVIPVSLTVPIATLSPGSYRLEVKATHSPGTDPVIRLADFEVE